MFIRTGFESIKRFIENNPIAAGEWRFIELQFSSSVTNYGYKHSLNFTPSDVIQTSVIWTSTVGTVTWNYTSFTSTDINITVTQPCTIRAFIGRSG